MPDAKISDLPAGGDPQDDDAFVVARGATNVSLAWSSLSNAATQNNIALTLDGNTAGALALASSGTVTLAGGNNITLSQNGNAITISGANAGGAQTGISGIANSETTYTSGTVSLSELGAITIRSTTGNQYQLSVDPQSVQPETQTFIGGISASDALFTSGTVRITGVGGGITVGTNTGQRIDLSVAAQSVQPETQTFIAGISASDTLYTSGNVRFTGSQAATVRSGTGQLVVIDVPAQTAQTGISGIANSQTTYTSGTVSLSELGAITIRSTTGNQFQLSVNSQSVQTNDIPRLGVSTGGNTSGDTTVNSGTRFVLVGSNGITLSQGTAASATTVTISGITQSVQTQGVLSAGVSTGGNTAGNTTVNTGSRFVIVGSNGITASQGTAAGATTVTLSGITQSVQTQDVLSVGVSTGGNTAGNTTVNTGSRFVIVGSNGITASQGTAAGATTVTLSGITQTEQTQGILRAGVSTGGNTSGDTTVNSGTRLVFVGSNNITLSQGTAANATTITISGPTAAAQTVQTQGILNVALSNIGNTAGDTGINSGTRYVLAGGNGITLSGSSAANATTVTISGITQSVQTNDIPRLGVSTAGNTAGDTTVNSGTRFVLVGTNMISLSQTTGASATTVSINATNQNLSAGVSNVGNTSGNTTVNTGSRLVLAGGNNITLSQGTAAGATTITISAPNLGAGAMSAGASNLGNTAGSTGITGTQLVLVGSDNITLSQSTGANGGTLSIIGPAAGGFSAGMSTEGNTAGNTGVTGTRLVLVGTGPVSLSQTTGAAGGTLSINAPATSSLSATGNIQISTNGSTISIGDGANVIQFWDNLVPGASTTFQLANATMNIWPLNPANAAFPGYMSVSSVFLDLSATVSTGAAFTRSFSMGIYTMVNSTSLALLYSASTSIGTGAAAAGITNSYGGRRWLTYHSSQFNNAPNFAEGSDYFLALWERSTSGSQTITYQGQLLPYATGVRSGIMGAASSSDTTRGQYPFLGNYSVSFSTAMPANLAASDVNKSNATAISLPRIIFNNIGSNIV